jgi:hypothetical protein
MFDLETWGKLPGCDIRSIGACVFAPVARHGGSLVHDGSLGTIKPFYVATENPMRDSFDFGDIGFHPHTGERYISKYPLTRDPGTVKWWSEQSPDAQAAFANPVDLRDALEQFSRWLIQQGDINDLRLWANDPHFDEAILVMVYRACGMVEPWHYRSPRSMKTICDLANITRDDMAQFNHGTMHNALDDAISQAMIVCEGYKRLGLQK